MICRHALEQKHGPRGDIVDRADCEFGGGLLRIVGVHEPVPPLRFISRRKIEFDHFVMRVEYDQERRVIASTFDSVA